MGDVRFVVRIARRTPPAQLVLVGVPGPGPDVEGFQDSHVIGATAHVAGDRREILHIARVDATAEHAGTTLDGSGLDPRTILLAVRTAGHEVCGRCDVDAGAKQRFQMVDVGMQWHVDDAVRFQRNDLVDVVRRRDTESAVEPAQLTEVLAHFVRAVGEYADQFQAGAFENAFDRFTRDVPGGPLHQADRGVGH